MPDIINLNRVRKQKARAERKAGAAENRVRSGRTKVERAAAKSAAEKAEREIAAHHIDPHDRADTDEDR